MGAFVHELDGYRLTIHPSDGRGRLDAAGDDRPVWRGSVLPTLHLATPQGPQVAHARATVEEEGPDALLLRLDYGPWASGRVRLRGWASGVELGDLELDLADDAHLVDLYVGLSPVEGAARAAIPDPDYPEWPDWQADAFCIPSARPAPPASVVRRWDLGQASVALGLFGPTLGSPYGAAYPRPLWSAGFGDDRGWLVAGPAEVPDAALTLDVRGTAAAFRWHYREDLWPVPERRRRWTVPLRMTWAADPLTAYGRLFASFPARQAPPVPAAFGSTVNTWGDFRGGDLRLDPTIDAALRLGADVLVVDDGWETSQSTGVLDAARHPRFDEDLARMAAVGLRVGFWQAVGWVPDAPSVGLTDDDLLLGRDGRPVTCNWSADPRDPAQHHALDPSSPRARRYLADRIAAIVRRYRPAILKLDFGYGLPAPSQAVPRDPAYRGERMGHELYRIASEAAHAADPEVAIQLYGVHPLHTAIADVVALDDMGDHGADAEGLGHRHWSVWATLAAASGVVVNGSSGYSWDQDAEVVLDSLVLGVPGVILPLQDPANPPGPDRLALRRAAHRWYRRAASWQPVWLDSELGRVDRQPDVRSWARSERGALTVACLRDVSRGRIAHPGLAGVEHEGDWALVVLEGEGLGDPAARIAVVPAGAGRITLPLPGGGARLETWVDGRVAAADSLVTDRLTLEATGPERLAGLEGWVVQGAGHPARR